MKIVLKHKNIAKILHKFNFFDDILIFFNYALFFKNADLKKL